MPQWAFVMGTVPVPGGGGSRCVVRRLKRAGTRFAPTSCVKKVPVNCPRKEDVVKKNVLTALGLAFLLVFGFACTTTNPPPPPPPETDTSPPPPPPEDERDFESPTDAELHDRVHAALSRVPELDGTDISVRVEGSQVHLGGHVHTAEQKQIAHDVVHSVEGVSRVFHGGIVVR